MARHGSRRRQPTPFEMEIRSMPRSGPSGYYFPYSGNFYDRSSYNPAYSDGIIGPHEVDALLNEINNHPLIQVGVCSKWACFLFLSFAPFVLSLVNLFGLFKKDAFSVPRFVIAIIFFVVALVAVIYFWRNLARFHAERLALREQGINEIIKKHEMTTFQGKNVLIRMSTHHGYIAMEFLWKHGNTYNPTTVGGMMPPHMAAGYGMPPPMGPNYGMTQQMGMGYPNHQQLPPGFGGPQQLPPGFENHQQLPPGFGVPQPSGPSNGMLQSTQPSYGNNSHAEQGYPVPPPPPSLPGSNPMDQQPDIHAQFIQP